MTLPILSPGLREYAHSRYLRRTSSLQNLAIPSRTLIETLDDDRRTLLELLIGTLPLTDILDREPSTLLDYVDHALDLRRNADWTASLLEDVFIHYVFWPRINNERLTPCRSRIANDLRERIAGLDMEHAAIETNYWCAEHVTYAPSDGRTIGPLGALNRGIGRCGEESTLLVSALRAIGIPARQVYVPRWAHCDDNHAWVEAMIDGHWRFMGACEPEERLDRGWFDRASARAILVHARTFCDYTSGSLTSLDSAGTGDEALLENVTATYAPTSRLTITVFADDGTPAPEATVTLELLNMAEFTPIATLRCDANGRATITLGRGTVLVHVTSDDHFGERLVTVSDDVDIAVPLDDTMHADEGLAAAIADGWTAMTITAPAAGQSNAATLTDDERERGTQRAQHAESLRVERLAGFARQSAQGNDIVDNLLNMAGANWPQIAQFLAKDDNPDRLALVQALSDKDLSDVSSDTLDDALTAAEAIRDVAMMGVLADADASTRNTLWRDYVLNPRVSTEELAADHCRLQRLIGDDAASFRTAPRMLWHHLASTTNNAPDDFPYTGTATLWTSGMGTTEHVDVAFVTACRCLGIPARLDPTTARPQFFHDGRFITVSDVPTHTVPDTPVTFVIDQRHDDMPRYATDWTIGRWRHTDHGMDVVSLDLSEIKWHDNALTVNLEPGQYRVITTVRLPNGNQLAAMRSFTITDSPTVIDVRWRTPDEHDLLEHMPLENLPFTDEAGVVTPLHDVLHGRKAVLFILDARGSEPSIHVLDELRDHLATHPNTTVEPIIALCPSSSPASDAIMRMMDQLPRPVATWHCNQYTASRLARITFVDPDKMPLIISAQPAESGASPAIGVYACSGYNVGSVELALRLSRM